MPIVVTSPKLIRPKRDFDVRVTNTDPDPAIVVSMTVDGVARKFRITDEDAPPPADANEIDEPRFEHPRVAVANVRYTMTITDWGDATPGQVIVVRVDSAGGSDSGESTVVPPAEP
jgi:hypothetical protein